MKSLENHSDAELYAMLPSTTGNQAFQCLYDRYAIRVFNYCINMLGSRDDAEDALQETWIQFHKTGATAKTPVEHVRGYLYKMAHNACLMTIRKKRTDTVNIDDVEVPSLSVDPSKQQELQELLQLALSTLALPHREAFLLHDVEGFSYEEMSALLGESVHTLRNRVWRSRTQIRTILTPYVGDYR